MTPIAPTRAPGTKVGITVAVAFGIALGIVGATQVLGPSTGACSGIGTGVGGATVGAYTFGWLHVAPSTAATPGQVQNAGNCPVSLAGYNIVQLGYNDATGGFSSKANFDTLLNYLHATMGMNVVRISVNSKWYADNYAMPSSKWPFANGITDYQSFVAFLVTETAKYGLYLDLTANSMFPEAINATFATNQQGDTDFTGTGNYTPQFRYNAFGCSDGGVITSTLSMWSSLSSTFANDPHLIYNTWGEMKAQCGRGPDTDADTSTTYADGQALNSYTAYNGGAGNGDAANAATGIVYPDTRAYSVWKNHQDALIRAIRANSPHSLISLTGQSFGNNYCPLTGNPSPQSRTTCSGNAVLPDFAEANLLWDYHSYANACFDGGACGSATGGYMVKKSSYPTNADWQFTRAGETNNTNPVSYPRGLLYGETMGTMDTTNANDYPCYVYPELKAKHGAGVIGFEANNLGGGGFLNNPSGVGLNSMGQSQVNNFAYLRGAAPHVLEEDDTTVCPGT